MKVIPAHGASAFTGLRDLNLSGGVRSTTTAGEITRAGLGGAGAWRGVGNGAAAMRADLIEDRDTATHTTLYADRAFALKCMQNAIGLAGPDIKSVSNLFGHRRIAMFRYVIAQKFQAFDGLRAVHAATS